MLVLVLVLAVTNLITLGALVRRPRPANDTDDVAEVFEAPRPPGVAERHRRLITVEILNPIELASARVGRIGGLAGTLAPGLTRRVVYDQTLKTLRRELDALAVRADVRVHALRAIERHTEPGEDQSVIEAVVVDEVAPLDLSRDADREVNPDTDR